MNKVFITGGNGFIGSHIVEAFIRRGDVEVTCLVRHGADLSALSGLPLRLIEGDLSDREKLAGVFSGMDCVVHNAAKAGDWGRYAEFYETNVNGVENVMEACGKAGVKHVIMTGTCSVYGEENNLRVKDEEYGFHSHYRYFCGEVFPCGMNFYRDTKSLGEQCAIGIARRLGFDLTILEPVWVYGERERNTGFYDYLLSVKDGMFVMPGSRKNRFHVVYAGDLARAYVLAYEKRLKGIEKIIIGNPAAEKMEAIFHRFCTDAGLKPPMSWPKWIFYPIGLLLEFLSSVFKTKKPPLLTRGRVNMFYDSIEYSTAKAERLLGFRAEVPLEEGIARTVKWYLEHHWI